MVNSYYCFVELKVGWPGRFHDKTCTENSNFWYTMNANRETWLGKNGVALADSAWGVGSNLVMTPYTLKDDSTKAHQWYNFVQFCAQFHTIFCGGSVWSMEKSIQVSFHSASFHI